MIKNSFKHVNQNAFYKIFIWLLLFSISLCFSSCNNTEKESNINPVTIGEITCGYDDQICFSTTHDIVRTEEGYYFCSDRNILCFFDPITKKTVPVCSRPNCSHTSDEKECDANLHSIKKISGIWYYDNEIYIGSYDYEKYTYYLIRISKDGSRRTRCCNLLSLDPETTEKGVSGGDIRNLMIHRGYAYFTAAESESKTSIYRVELKKNAAAKKIYTTGVAYAYLAAVRGYGNGLYFRESEPIKDSKSSYKSTLYYYDSHSGLLKMCLENLQSDCFPYEESIYFSNGTDFCRLETKSNAVKTIYKGKCRQSSSDGKYFYLDNNDLAYNDDKHVTVIDLDGNIVDEIVSNGVYCIFGDIDYLFYAKVTDARFIYMAFDKTQIGTDSRKWIDLVP